MQSELIEYSPDNLFDKIVSISSTRKLSLKDTPGIVTVINKEQLENYGAITLGELLGKTPSSLGVTSYLYTKGGLSIRGVVNSLVDNHALIMINGYHNPIYLGMPLSPIKRIEIARGPIAAIHGGNASSGVVNIITDDNAPTSVSTVIGENGTEIFEGVYSFTDSD